MFGSSKRDFLLTLYNSLFFKYYATFLKFFITLSTMLQAAVEVNVKALVQVLAMLCILMLSGGYSTL